MAKTGVSPVLETLGARGARRWMLAMLGMALPLVANAYSVVQAYQDALQNDSTWRSAKYENDAAFENKALGMSGLLPTVSANYSRSRNEADFTQKFGGQSNTTHPHYTSASSSVSLRQSIFNLDALARYRQGIAQAQSGEALFGSRHHELMLRVVSAYVDLLFSADQLTLAVAQRDTLQEQKRVNERLFAKGEGTKTDVLETQARLDLAEAQVVEVRDGQTVARNALAAIVGREVGQLDTLLASFKPMPLQPAELDAWKTLATNNNPELQAQYFSVEVSRQEIARNRAGHLPRLDFVANLSQGSQESLTTLNQDSTVRSAGLQLSIPLYSGGYVNAATNQASANYLRAKADFDVRSDRIMNDLQRQYYQVTGAVAKLEALGKAVESARALITATQQSIKGGVRINLDLLNARAQFYLAQRDLAQARYNYLQAYMRLRADAGVLSIEDLKRLAAYFSDRR
jgi:protease secretion system outer membrane protein